MKLGDRERAREKTGVIRSTLLILSIGLLFALGYHFDPTQKDLPSKPSRHIAIDASSNSFEAAETVESQSVPQPENTQSTQLKLENQGSLSDEGLSWAAKTYREAGKIEFDQKLKAWTVNVGETLNSGDRLVYVGGDGRVELNETKIYFQDGSSQVIQNLSGTFYSKDWQQWLVGKNKIEKIEITGRALTDAGTLRLFVQKL